MFIDFWQEIVDDGEKNKFGLKFRSRLYLLTLLFLLSGLGIVCSLHPASSVCHGPRYNLTGGAQNR